MTAAGIDRIIRSRTTRRWLYGLSAATVALAAVYGLVDGQEAAAWLVWCSALLGLATLNVPPTFGAGTQENLSSTAPPAGTETTDFPV